VTAVEAEGEVMGFAKNLGEGIYATHRRRVILQAPRGTKTVEIRGRKYSKDDVIWLKNRKTGKIFPVPKQAYRAAGQGFKGRYGTKKGWKAVGRKAGAFVVGNVIAPGLGSVNATASKGKFKYSQRRKLEKKYGKWVKKGVRTRL
jgi:hypothetical protein